MIWLRDLITDLFTPSGAETDYQWSVIAIGHATAIGAAFSVLIGWWIVPVYAMKEANDLRLGGRKLDSAADMAFVAIGCTYTGDAWWPWLILSAAFIGLIIRNHAR